ncbi:MAG: DNA primase [Clostridia bacterium]|nr:DNA primase [Clostridia bacterium]
MSLYFTDDFLQEVMDKNDIVEYVSKSVHLKRTGSTFKGLCPFHKEKTPSFSVSADKQLFYCFGCGKGGTVINYVMLSENLDFVEAVKLLAEKCGMDIPEQNNQNVDNNSKLKQTIYRINTVSGRFFYEKLSENCGSNAREYIKKRELAKQTVNRFGLGYAPDGNLLLKFLRSQGFSDDEIVASGVVGKSENGDLYDRFRNRLMFPIIDVRKNIIGFGGRVLDDSKPKYLNSPETAAFNKSYNLFGLNIAKNSVENYLLLVEGYMDVIQLHQHGINTAVATLGTSLTTEQARIIKRIKNEVIISYDSDEAGQKATQRAIEILSEEGLRVRVLTMHGSKDPDEYIKANGAGAFRKLIEDSQEQIEYKLKQLKKRYDLENIRQKADYVNAAAKEFANIKSPVECELYVKKISAETGVSEQSIFSEVSRLKRLSEKDTEFKNFRNAQIKAGKPSDMRKKRYDDAQKIVINIMSNDKKQSDFIINNLSEECFEGEMKELFKILKEIRKNGSEPDAGIIVSSVPDAALAAEILHDDKNIEDLSLAARQAVQIILNYKNNEKMIKALSNEGLSSRDKIDTISAAISNKRKGVKDGDSK